MTERKRFIRLPEPIKLGERAIAFVESEIDEWIDQMIELSRNKSA